MDIESIRKEIERMNNLPRKHADYFNWHDKPTKELSIGQDFFKKIEDISEEYLVNIEIGEDPPDVKIKTNTKRLIGVELTELVDQKAIEYQIKGDRRYAERVAGWNRENTLAAIRAIIIKKDRLCRQTPDYYDSIMLVIFTDEPKLKSDTLKQYFEGHNWEHTQNIDRVYVLTGYEPEHGEKCLIYLG